MLRASIVMGQTPEKVYFADTVIIMSNRPSPERVGIQHHTIDSALMLSMQGRNVSEYLSMFTPVYIRTYGPGALASASIRGGSAAHTQILWNGMPLNNPMYGQSDLNLMPVNTANQISLQMGGSALQTGSGAVNGVLHMQTNPIYGLGLTGSGNLSVGSFNSRYTAASAGFSNAIWAARLQYWEQSADNDFRYRNITLPGRPEVQQQNAGFQNRGLQSGIGFRSRTIGQFQWDAMYLNTNRRIPPLMHQSVTAARQADAQFRTVLNWEYNGSYLFYQIKTGISSEALLFHDSLSSIQSDNQSLFQFSEGSAGMHLARRHTIRAAYWQSYAEARADGYAGAVGIQKRYALILSYQYTSMDSSLLLSGHGRQEIANQHTSNAMQTLPVMPAIGIQKYVTPALLLKSSASGVFRLPTLNDLYWSPSGNPNLEAERGWNADAGIDYRITWKQWVITPHTGIYYHHLDNRIQWQPGNFFWSPVNIAQTRAKGIEMHIRSEIKTQKYSAGLQVRYHRNRTYSTEHTEKQLLYVPQNTTGATLFIEKNTWRVLYSHAWTGFVFTTTDNSRWLPAYHTADITVEKNIKLKKQNLKIWGSCRNLMNIEYQIMEGRPMPGRGFWCGIDLQIASITP